MRFAVLLSLLVVACGGEGATGGQGGVGGVASDPCVEPAVALPDGSCLSPGVPEGACLEGFVPDGAWGCQPSLPAEPCPFGSLAVPGDTECREIMPCGEGPWGDLPVDGSSEHVDASYAGGNSDGSAERPWTTIGEAIQAASPGALVAVAEGTYAENVVLDRPLRLWGRCPALVRIDAPPVAASPCPPTAICIGSSASGSEVGGLAFTGQGFGLLISGSQDVLVDRVHAYDNLARGISAQVSLGPTSLTVRDSLVEGNRSAGVYASGATLLLERTAVRGTIPSGGLGGRGVTVQPPCDDQPDGSIVCDVTQRAAATIVGSLLEGNQEAGLAVTGSDAQVEATAILRTLPRDGALGRGAIVQLSCVDDPDGGQTCDPSARGQASLLGVTILDSHDIGLFSMGADLVADLTTVRGTRSEAATLDGGRGVHSQLACEADVAGLSCDPSSRGSLTLQRSAVVDNREVGLFVSGADLLLDRSVVARTQPRELDGKRGRGLSVQVACADLDAGTGSCLAEAASVATIVDTLVDDNRDMGIYAIGSAVSIARTVVRATGAEVAGGLFGDGITVLSLDGLPGAIELSASLIDGAERAAVVSFGSVLALSDNALRCASIDLVAQSVDGVLPPAVSDLGGNRCGCPEATGECKAVAADLSPPSPLP